MYAIASDSKDMTKFADEIEDLLELYNDDGTLSKEKF
jgi:hypothetical protein